MSNLYEDIDVRMEELRKIIRQKEKSLKRAPKGILNVHSIGERAQYYYKENSSDKTRRYIKTSEKKLVKELCQKDYDQRVRDAAEEELKALERLWRVYQNKTCEEIYESLHIHRQEFVTPLVVPDDFFIEEWEAVEYERMDFPEDYPEYYTDKGERVRSKSEIIIANTLNSRGISYRYEYPFYTEGSLVLHPDFTIMNLRKRKEVYWEHFGMMDDPEYVENVLKKLETYEKQGLFLGENLIATFESKKKPLNIKTVNLMIERYLE